MEITNKEIFNINIKKRIYEILDVPSDKDKLSSYVDILMMSLIILNIFVFVLETFKSIYNTFSNSFLEFEVASILIFSVEYLLRIWSCTVNPKYAHPLFGRIKFIFKPLMLIDLMSILPFYFALKNTNMLFLRAFRLIRLFRIFKLARYSQAIRLFGRVIYKKKEQLLVSLFFLFLLLVLSAFLIYSAENKAQPEAFSNIFDAFWWSFASFTTIGYGDIYPKTELGKIVASISSFIGIMIFALPTSILTSAFVEEYQETKKCPHCGKKL